MADSFFTTRNHYDMQVRTMDQMHCDMLLDAVARRYAVLNGPMGAAIRTQRVADICAVAHVLPIEHWKASDLPLPQPAKPAPPPAKPTFRTVWTRMVASVGDTGMFCGLVGFILGVIVASWK